jgi:soluble lytic murein transglycosylase-like protein
MVSRLVVLLTIALAACTPDDPPTVVVEPVAVDPVVVEAPVIVPVVTPPPQAAAQYRDTLTRYALVTWGLTAPVATFAAQIEQESAWNPEAVSRVGAAGLAQFMPATGKWIVEVYPHLGDHQPLNPVWAMGAMVQYNRHLYNRVAGTNHCERMAKTLSAYNGGLAWIPKAEAAAEKAGLDPARWFDHVETVNPGRSAGNYLENKNYPRRILLKLEPKYSEWGKGSC